jgi:hypothetical protein
LSRKKLHLEKKELRKERVPCKEKGAGKKIPYDFGIANPKVLEMLNILEKSEMALYSVLESFSRYKVRNKEDMEKEMKLKKLEGTMG